MKKFWVSIVLTLLLASSSSTPARADAESDEFFAQGRNICALLAGTPSDQQVTDAKGAFGQTFPSLNSQFRQNWFQLGCDQSFDRSASPNSPYRATVQNEVAKIYATFALRGTEVVVTWIPGASAPEGRFIDDQVRAYARIIGVNYSFTLPVDFRPGVPDWSDITGRSKSPVPPGSSPSPTPTPTATTTPTPSPTPTASPSPSPTATPTPPAAPKAFTKAPTPKISGTAKVGKTLTAKPGTWSPKPSLAYQWTRDGAPIQGATGKSYKLVAPDLGTTIAVTVTGTKSGYTTVTKSSKATSTIKAGSLARGKVKVTGVRRVGRVLTAKTSRWSSGVTYYYQWYRNGKAITGATGKSYVLSPTDHRDRFRVKVSTTKPGYTPSSSRTSPRTRKVRLGYLSKVTPTITGVAQVGQTLTVNVGTWKPAETTLAYQWYRVTSKGKVYRISGATSSSLTITQTLLGQRLKVKVTGKAAGYHTGSRTSSRTTWVVAAPLPEPPPPPPPSSSPSPSPSPSETP